MRDLKIKFLFILVSMCVSGLAFAELNNATRNKFSEEIRQLVDKKLAENNLTPNKPVDDETFVRRVYLDVIGRIPTYNEVKEFTESKDSQKRSKLIDRLLCY